MAVADDVDEFWQHLRYERCRINANIIERVSVEPLLEQLDLFRYFIHDERCIKTKL